MKSYRSPARPPRRPQERLHEHHSSETPYDWDETPEHRKLAYDPLGERDERRPMDWDRARSQARTRPSYRSSPSIDYSYDREVSDEGREDPHGDWYGQRDRGRSASEAPRQRGPHYGKGPKNYRRSDDSICEDASQRLQRHDEVDASEIEVSCSQGVLTLKGEVEDRPMKRMAEDCCEEVYGVDDVMNELKVSQGFFARLFSSSDD